MRRKSPRPEPDIEWLGLLPISTPPAKALQLGLVGPKATGQAQVPLWTDIAHAAAAASLGRASSEWVFMLVWLMAEGVMAKTRKLAAILAADVAADR